MHTDPFRDISPAVDADAAALTLPTRLELIGPAIDYLRHRAQLCGACDDDRGGRLVLALHEALTNAMVHGNLEVPSTLKEQPDNAFARALAERSADPQYAGRNVKIRFAYDGQRCDFVITDEGPGFDTARAMPPPAGPATDAAEPDADAFDPAALEAMLKCSGRGITIMRAMVDDLRYEQGGRQCVLSLCRGACGTPTPGDRRAEGRLAVQEPVRVLPVRVDGTVDWSTAWAAISRNVSAGGMAILQHHQAPAGVTAQVPGRVLIELKGADGSPVYVPAEVCRVTDAGDGMVQLGCRFVGEPQVPPATGDTAAKVTALLDRLTHPATTGQDERRAHPRVPYTATVEVRGHQDTTTRPAFSRDVSHGGMAFITSYELPRGQVELSLPVPGGDPLRVSATVVRCQRVANGVYDIGCKFT